jgi:HEPN domain-containing protein
MPLDRHDVPLRKAKQDELVLERLLDDRDVDDDTLGFHAQQAAEKLLKAALVSRKADYPRTHNLGVLIELLSDAGVTLPADLADIDRLTPFGTVFRYDEVLPQGGQDRSRWLDWIRGLRAFVEAAMD